jgi:hypothetical protein
MEVLSLIRLVFNLKTNLAPHLLINDLTTPKTMTLKQITCNLNGNSKIRRLVRSIIQTTGENSVKNANILKDYLLFLLPSFLQHDDRKHYKAWILLQVYESTTNIKFKYLIIFKLLRLLSKDPQNSLFRIGFRVMIETQGWEEAIILIVRYVEFNDCFDSSENTENKIQCLILYENFFQLLFYFHKRPNRPDKIITITRIINSVC